jgi:hypothetical protein
VACEQFRLANGRYPDQLDELVPKHLRSIPQAKYSLVYGDFRYWNMEGKPRLMWTVILPFGRKIYNFERREWGFHRLDCKLCGAASQSSGLGIAMLAPRESLNIFCSTFRLSCIRESPLLN